ncbi:hypothetical protein BDQ12DRAFT_716108 [Crucibulum laeve]|uniref:Uncharacterized protein n=1 Tax=Crucibulum laeve TaxID=68775 RepID=A0A5C3LW29_9AGAR|nr:hypothetical protein BDQ12DRAFT_716108 [Crucibulum laeve]
MPTPLKTGSALLLGIELVTDQLRASIVDESFELVGVESVNFDTELPEYHCMAVSFIFLALSLPPFPKLIGRIFTTPGDTYTTLVETWIKGLAPFITATKNGPTSPFLSLNYFSLRETRNTVGLLTLGPLLSFLALKELKTGGLGAVSSFFIELEELSLPLALLLLIRPIASLRLLLVDGLGSKGNMKTLMRRTRDPRIHVYDKSSRKGEAEHGADERPGDGGEDVDAGGTRNGVEVVVLPREECV